MRVPRSLLHVGTCCAMAATPLAPAATPVSPPGFGQPYPFDVDNDARRMQLRGSIPSRYPGLARIVGLDPFEELQLFDLLAKQMSAGPRGTVRGDVADPAELPERMRAALARQAADDAELLSLLGAERFARWQQYQSLQPVHQLVSQLRARLATNGEVISNETSDRLVAAIAESDRNAFSERMRQSSTLPSSGEMRIPDAAANAQRLAERQARVLAVAAPILGPLQTDAFRRMMDEQAQLTRGMIPQLQQMQRAQPP